MLKIQNKYNVALSDVMIGLIAIFSLTYIILDEFKIHLEEQDSLYLFLLIIFLNVFIVLYSLELMRIMRMNKFIKELWKPSRKLKTPFYSIVFLMFLAGAISSSQEILSAVIFGGLIFSSIFFLYIYRTVTRPSLTKTKTRNAVIVGAGMLGKKLLNKIKENSNEYNVVGFIDDNIEKDVVVYNNKKILGHIKDFKEIKNLYNLKDVFISIDEVDYSSILKIVDKVKETDVKVKLLSPLFQIIPEKKLPIERLDGLELVGLSNSDDRYIILKLKRIGDILLTSVGLVFLSPVFLVIALLIKLGSKGPIVFKQIRIGQNGIPFKFYKFRSMYYQKEEDEERKEMMLEFMKKHKTQADDTKIINEKRVTWIGKYLRKTSLDELPQLFNVLKGEMSLVGPRPCLPYEYENYEEWQKRRLKVLPGCTGVWQVSGRSSVMFDDSVVLDLYYINNISLILDLKIILKTIPVMFFSKGGK